MFDDLDNYQLENITEENIKNCMQNFREFRQKCEYEVKVSKKWDRHSFFKRSTKYKNLYSSIDETNNKDLKIHEYEQGESGFTFDSGIRVTVKNLEILR